MSAAAGEMEAGDNQPDTSRWLCKFCAFEEGTSGTLELGLGNVSADSYRFGRYSGLNDQGLFPVLDASLLGVGEEGRYWSIDASDLGLDSRSVSVEAGRQGSYKVNLDYDELPNLISDSSETPYLGTGGDTLTLPASWVRGSTTGTMTDLSNSLHGESLSTNRKRLGLGTTFIASDAWQYAVNFKDEVREGTKAVGSTFFFSSAQLVMPVNYYTRQIDVSAAYTGEKLQTKLAYYGSTFNDEDVALTWDNPYSAGGGVDQGQMALAPDNQFHQILAALGYHVSDATRITADLALGRTTQNEDFLPATTNSTLAAVSLPHSSLQGRVDTIDANIKLMSIVSPKLRLNAAYLYNDHNDKTPRADFTWVSTDISTNATTRTNLPYSFTKSLLKLSADYRFTGKSKAAVGFDGNKMKRDYQEVSDSNENTVWAKASTRAIGNTDVALKVAHAERDIGHYEVLPWLNPVENSLMRKYNMADRTRELGSLRIDFLGHEDYSLGLAVEYSNDDYDNSQVGLQESRMLSYSVDGSVVLSPQTHIFAFINREATNSKQAGSAAAAAPDWSAQNNDAVNTFGVGIKQAVIEDKLDVGADFNLSRAIGEVKVNAGVAAPGLPDISTRLSTLKLYTSYKLEENLSVNGSYIHEQYKSENWALDGVTPDAISNVLTLGDQPPAYHVNVIMVSMRYTFM